MKCVGCGNRYRFAWVCCCAVDRRTIQMLLLKFSIVSCGNEIQYNFTEKMRILFCVSKDFWLNIKTEPQKHNHTHQSHLYRFILFNNSFLLPSPATSHTIEQPIWYAAAAAAESIHRSSMKKDQTHSIES